MKVVHWTLRSSAVPNMCSTALQVYNVILGLTRACNLLRIVLYSSMAFLGPPVPSALASFLYSSLPCGFAVGPSRLHEGRLGLWWVGRSLEAGSLLGRDGDIEWASEYHAEPEIHSQDGKLATNFETERDQATRTEEEQVMHSAHSMQTEWAIVTFNIDCA